MADVAIRKCQRESFMECMQNYPLFKALPKTQQLTVARKLERSCYNANIEKSHKNHIPNYWDNSTFVEQYETICYNIKVNLDPESSVNKECSEKARNFLPKRIYNSVIAGFIRVIWQKVNLPTKLLELVLQRLPQIRPEEVGKMNSIEMNPLISKKFIEDITLRSKQMIKKKYTTMYPCPKYGHRQATIRSQQTKSGDEGVTHFLNCLICGDRWRI